MYAALNSTTRPPRGANGAAVARSGGSDSAPDPGPASRAATDNRRNRFPFPHLTDRRHEPPWRSRRRRARRKPKVGARTPLLLERGSTSGHLPAVVRPIGRGLGDRGAPIPAPPGG